MYTVLKKSHSIYKFKLVILLTKMKIFIFFPTTVIEYSHIYKTKRNFFKKSKDMKSSKQQKYTFKRKKNFMIFYDYLHFTFTGIEI